MGDDDRASISEDFRMFSLTVTGSPEDDLEDVQETFDEEVEAAEARARRLDEDLKDAREPNRGAHR